LITESHFTSTQSFSPGVNFINILRAPFTVESVLHSFSLLQFGFVVFGRKNIGEKAARKMLMKLTTAIHYLRAYLHLKGHKDKRKITTYLSQI